MRDLIAVESDKSSGGSAFLNPILNTSTCGLTANTNDLVT